MGTEEFKENSPPNKFSSGFFKMGTTVAKKEISAEENSSFLSSPPTCFGAGPKQTIKCIKCGSEFLNETYKFCYACGEKKPQPTSDFTFKTENAFNVSSA